jgi:alkylresorcinol/alkylpyrone synthase
MSFDVEILSVATANPKFCIRQHEIDRNDMSLENIRGFLFHPGGAKVLVTIEQVLGIDQAMLVHSWEILRQHGNMSSATALFVLERALKAGANGPHLLAAFGPGFSAYLMIADL